MRAELWNRVDAVLRQLLPLDETARASAIADCCGDDEELRREVESLLQQERDSARLFDVPEGGGERGLGAGDTVGRYRLVRLIAEGGMGEVWLAERSDGHYAEQVAVKLLRSRRAGVGLRRRFQRERQLMVQLVHPGIARLLDGGALPDGRPFLVMEYVDGAPLTEYCDQRQLGVVARIQLFLNVCRAVQHAHRHLVVHRDLKPSNILVQADGTPKLLDFGIAKVIGQTSDAVELTASGLRLMTLRYASPEQIDGAVITTASDVYSLGVVLFELLTGLMVFPGADSHAAWERAVRSEEPQRPSTAVRRHFAADGHWAAAAGLHARPKELCAQLDGDLDAIVMRAMRKDPEARYASVDHLCEDLQRHLRAEPVLARRGTVRYRVSRFVRRHCVLLVAAVAVVASLVVGVLVALGQAREAEWRRGEAEAAGQRAAKHAERAADEASRANRVLDFVQSVFLGSDPYTSDRLLTAEQALERAAARIGTEFADDPAAAARIYGVLGSGYLGQGRYARAEAHLQRALELYERLPEAAPQELGSIYCNLGRVAEARGDLVNAAAHSERALQLLVAAHGPLHVEVALVINNLGVIARKQNDVETAERLLTLAADQRLALLGESSPELAETWNNLAALRRARGDRDAAEALLVRVVAARERSLGNTHPATLSAMTNLAVLLAEARRLAEAETMLREALARAAVSLGSDHPDRAHMARSLGKVIWWGGDALAALPWLQEAARIHAIELSPIHPSRMAAVRDLALCTSEAGGAYQAVELLQRHLDAVEALVGGDVDAAATAAAAQLRSDLDRLPQGRRGG